MVCLMAKIETLDNFAKICFEILRSDRDCNLATGGFTGEGKTFCRGQKILMFDGSIKKVEDVKVNDLVMGDDSTSRKVLSLHNGFGELFKVSQVKGEPYVVNKEHILSLKRTRTQRFRNDNPKREKRSRPDKKGLVKNVAVKDYLNWSKAQKHFWKGYKVAVNFPEKSLRIEPYFLGLWLGDGNGRDARITTIDSEIIEYLIYLGKKLNLKPHFGINKKSKALCVNLSKKSGIKNFIREIFKYYNLFNNKHIPHVFKINSRESRLNLLAGLIDTDGYVNHEGYVFVNKNKRLAEDVLFLARSLGFYACMKSFFNKKYQRNYFKVGISGDCSVVPVKVERKKVKARRQIKDVLVTGIKLSSCGEGEYFGFETDGNGLFLLSDFTVVHNSAWLTKLFQAYSRVSGIRWNFDYMTWSRKELLEWIDGKKGGKVGKSGLREGQLPEYSGVDVDELWMLFYKRNWYDEGQIDSIGTLNMCRDRHLFIAGNVPNFWDLDSAFSTRIRFYCYVPRRSVAWVFEQENNPFAIDPWNKNFNAKLFRRIKNPYSSPNFVCEVHFPDWSVEEKSLYYEIRNRKRVKAIDEFKGDERRERYTSIKGQRDKLIKLMFAESDEKVKVCKEVLCDACRKATKDSLGQTLSNKDVADVIGISKEAARLIRLGER